MILSATNKKLSLNYEYISELMTHIETYFYIRLNTKMHAIICILKLLIDDGFIGLFRWSTYLIKMEAVQCSIQYE